MGLESLLLDALLLFCAVFLRFFVFSSEASFLGLFTISPRSTRSIAMLIFTSVGATRSQGIIRVVVTFFWHSHFLEDLEAQQILTFLLCLLIFYFCCDIFLTFSFLEDF